MATFPGDIYAAPGVYTETNFTFPQEAPIAGVLLPVLIGTGNEVLLQEDLEIVRGSSSQVDQRVTDEDSAGRAVLDINETTGQITLGDFTGDLDQFQVRNFPIVDGRGAGAVTNQVVHVQVTVNNFPAVVLDVDGTRGLVTIAATPDIGDSVRVSYFFNREDTKQTDNVSSQVSPLNAEILGTISEPVAGYEFTVDNNIFDLTIDGTIFSINLGTGFKSAETVTTLLQTQTLGSSLAPSTYTDNFQGLAVRLVADQSLTIGGGSANSVLGFTEGMSTNRRVTFITFNGPIVDGSNGGITSTDPANVVVRVNNVQVIPTALDGATRAVTLSFAPAAGSIVTIEYFYNTWQNTFDLLQNNDVTELLRVGIIPGDSTFTEEVDYILKDDKILWGSAFLVTSGEHSQNAPFFGDSQITVSLVDNKAFFEPCTAVVDTSVNPPVQSTRKFDLPFVPTTGNGRSTPLGLELFNSITNGRSDVQTNRPDLVTAYWGFSFEDAQERGPVPVLEVEGVTITLANAVPVGADVFASFYYNTLTDGEFTVRSEVPGGSGLGQYSIQDKDQNSVLIPQFGTKSAGLSVVPINFPSGSELKPDVRFEGGVPVEETVSVTFAETAATLAKFTVRGPDPYFTIQDASDHVRLLVDGANLAAGASGIDVSRVNGVEGLGFPASVLGEEIVYEEDTGLTSYDIQSGINDRIAATFDGVLVDATVFANATGTAQDYVDALNVEAKLSANAPFYTGASRFLGSSTITAGEYDQLQFAYNGDVSGITGTISATIAPGTYSSPTLLAAAVQTAVDTAIGTLPVTFNGLGIGVTADANGSLSFALEGLPAADQAIPATGTATALGVPLTTTLTVGAVTLTGGDTQLSGGLDFDVGRADGTATASGVLPADALTIGGVTLTASGSQTGGGLNFDEGDQAIGSVTAAAVLPADTVTIGGIALTASNSQTPSGLDFDEGDQATGLVTTVGVEPADTVTIDGIIFTASGTQTSGGLDFDEGDQATGTITAAGVLPADTVTVSGITLTASNSQTGGGLDFDEGVQATATVATLAVLPGDTVTVNSVLLTASNSQTPGGLDFDEGDQATGSVTALGVIPGDTVTVTGVVLTASGSQTGGGTDFDEGVQATATVTTAAVLPGDTVTVAGITLTASNSQSGGGLDFDEGTQATATVTVAGPMVGGETITINGNLLSNAGAPRSSGSDDWDGTLGTDILIASDIVAAVNDVANSFDTDVTATNVSGTSAIVTLTAVIPGAVGNSITLVSSDGVRLAVSGNLGSVVTGVGTDTTVAASIASAVNDVGNGISTTVSAGSAVAVVTLTAVTPGTAGNSITLVSSDAGRLLTSGAVLGSVISGVGTDTTVAASIADAINDGANGIVATATALATANTVAITAVVPGAVGNGITLASSDSPGRLTVSGANLSGGVGTDTTVAASIAAAVNDAGNGIVTVVSASSAVATVTLTAVTPGTAGNSIPLASSDDPGRLTISGATLGTVIPGVGTDTTVAASIASAVNDVGNGIFSSVSALAAGAVVSLTAVTPGSAGNSITLASSDDPGRLSTTGPTLSGGAGDDTTVAASLAAAVNDPANGLSVSVTAVAGTPTGDDVSLTAVVPGAVGNGITLVSSNGTRLGVSGANFTGGVGTDTTVAASLAAAINDVGNGLSVSVTASPSAAIVSLTAVTPGILGNSITLASSDNPGRLTTSGTTLTGGVGDNPTVAASIMAAINDAGNGLNGLVAATIVGATVTITADNPGIAGNTIVLTSSNGTNLPVSGAGTLAGGLDDIGVATSITAAINDVSNGLTTLVIADNGGGSSSIVTMTAATAGPGGNLIVLVSSDGSALAVSGTGTLAGGDNTNGGYLEFLDATAPAADFSTLSGLSTAASPSGSQVKILNTDVARRFTVTDGTGRLQYDRIILRGRIVPGSGSLSSFASIPQAGILVEGSSGTVNAGLVTNSVGLAGARGTVDRATLAGFIPVNNNQVPSGTHGDERDGQTFVTFRADGGTEPQNNVFKINIDSVGIDVVFTDAAGVAIPTAGTADVPLGPVGIANTVLYQIRAAVVAAGFSATKTVFQEGSGIRLESNTSTSDSVVTIGQGSANAELGFSQGATANRVPVEAGKLASALMAHHSGTLPAFYLNYDSPATNWFAAQALAGVINNEANAQFLYVQSQANTVGGLGTSSSIVWQEPATGNGSVLLPGTLLLTQHGDGASGEQAKSGFYVTSTDPGGSGSQNDSVFNSGTGEDGFVGQTYHDDKTGLTFVVLPLETGGNYPLGESFTWTVKSVVRTDANLPTNAIPGTEVVVSNTLGVPKDDTAIVSTFRKEGSEPAVGDFYYASYNFTKGDFSTKLFTRTNAIVDEYGEVGPDNPLSLGGNLCKQNGALLVGLKQVEKDEGKNTAGIAKYRDAIIELNGQLPGGTNVDIITPLTVGATVAEQTDLLVFAGQQADIQSSLRFRSERTIVSGVGAGMKPSQVKIMAETIQRTRVRILYPDVVLLTLTDTFGNDQQSFVDGYFIAAAWDGFLTGTDSDVATPWTNKRIIGFDGIGRVLDQVEKNSIAQSGVTVVEEGSSAAFLNIRDGLTTDMQNILVRLPTVITIADEVHRRSRAALRGFIGSKFLPGLLPQIEANLAQVMKGLVFSLIIEAFAGISAETDPENVTTALVVAFYRPIFPTKYIKITFGLTAATI